MEGTSRFALIFTALLIASVAFFLNLGDHRNYGPSSEGSEKLLYRYRFQSITSHDISFYSNGIFEDYLGSCIPDGAVESKGRYKQEGDEFHLFYSVDSGGRRCVTKIQAHRVKWGIYDLLIPDWEMPDFCNFYNSRWISDTSNAALIPFWGLPYFTLMDTNGSIPRTSPTGVPELPPQWQTCLLEHPLQGTIISIEPDSQSVTIDIGSSHKVYRGCDFFGPQSIFGYESFTVVRVAPDSSIIRPIHRLEMLQNAEDLLGYARERGDSGRVKSYVAYIPTKQRGVDSLMERFKLGMELKSRP